MSGADEKAPWLCHVCGYSSTIGEGQACSQCYKIACRKHLLTSTVLNPDSGLYEFRQTCVECQLRQQL